MFICLFVVYLFVCFCKERLKSLKKDIWKTTGEADWSYTENLFTESGEEYSKNKNKNFGHH